MLQQITDTIFDDVPSKDEKTGMAYVVLYSQDIAGLITDDGLLPIYCHNVILCAEQVTNPRNFPNNVILFAEQSQKSKNLRKN